MDIGEITEGEIGAAVALWDRCGLLRPWNDPFRDIALAIGCATSTVLVGRDDGRLVATAMIGFDGHRGWFYYVAVDPDLQRQGLGRAIMAAGEDWLRERGAPKAQLMVRNTNAAAAGFYESLGYSDQASLVLGKFFPRNEPAED